MLIQNEDVKVVYFQDMEIGEVHNYIEKIYIYVNVNYFQIYEIDEQLFFLINTKMTLSKLCLKMVTLLISELLYKNQHYFINDTNLLLALYIEFF